MMPREEAFQNSVVPDFGNITTKINITGIITLAEKQDQYINTQVIDKYFPDNSIGLDIFLGGNSISKSNHLPSK